MVDEILRCRAIDSHTAGEPTRVIVDGGPDLGAGDAAARLRVLRERFDAFRTGVILEPRGSDVLVGALLLPPSDPSCAVAVVFFNNAGYLGMCGHGTIGVVATLAHLGRLAPGRHRIETPVGTVEAELHEDGAVSVANVPARAQRLDVRLDVPGRGTVTGDVAWGGNWFFLTRAPDLPLDAAHLPELTAYASDLKRALAAAGVSGAGGAEIDHVELFGEGSAGADSRSFVLCPGGAFDRSPCGTGTSAKLACLQARGELEPGRTWVQESVIGSRFEARYAAPPAGADGGILPTITGRAWITAELELRFDPTDPYRWGIR